MKITWLGHAAFRIDHGSHAILIDPFLSGNPSFNGSIDSVSQGVTHVLLTHGHDDHLGDSVDILNQTGAMAVANFELCMYLTAKGVSDQKINPGNHGGTVECGGFTVSFVQAVHSSSSQTGDGGNVYLGNSAGLVLHFPDGPTVYHMGDTDIFSDMALINELHSPNVGMVPIGDRFTMGGALAALACRRYFKFDTIIPCHFGSFPIIDQSADTFVAAMEDDAARVKVLSPGSSIEV